MQLGGGPKVLYSFIASERRNIYKHIYGTSKTI